MYKKTASKSIPKNMLITNTSSINSKCTIKQEILKTIKFFDMIKYENFLWNLKNQCMQWNKKMQKIYFVNIHIELSDASIRILDSCMVDL